MNFIIVPHSLRHVVQQFAVIYIGVSRFLTNMVHHFSSFLATHPKNFLTVMILSLIVATKISHFYIDLICSYPCGTVFHCFTRKSTKKCHILG